ncbi:MAG: SprT-like domain-containing protein [Acidobacteriota bacterium]|nr:SprT-like domain-containing protein [Acidobacteriota bacterium]
MQDTGGALQSALFFETPEEIYSRVFRELKPRSPAPEIQIVYRRFANASSSIRLREGAIQVRVTDMLEGAPAPVMEALAYILLAKLFRKPIPKIYAHRYRLYLNRREMRRQMQLVKQARGRKFLSGPQGKTHNLDEIFEKLNAAYFDGLLGRPSLGWSRGKSRNVLGHFDPSHNAIVISRIFDDPRAPKPALDYVMFHEMLHLQFPVDHSGARRCVHTPEFKAAERKFPDYKSAKEMLKKL